jgi:hypothetical protein
MKTMIRTKTVAIAVTLFTTAIGTLLMKTHAVHAQNTGRVFELRTYTCNEGKLPDLQKRFRDHTIEIFNRHHMTSIGYWIPQDPPLSENTLIYILAHPSREEAKANWKAFGADPEWRKVQSESEANGKIVNHVVSVFMDPADYSPLK